VQRIAIVGTSGSGKTTLGRDVARRIGAVSVDLDELNWEPGWTSVSHEEFRARLERALEVPSWVTSGNYSKAQEVYLGQADTLVWLDYSLPVVMARMLRRTARRVMLHEVCCNGNYESWRTTFSRDSVVLWALRTYRRRKAQYGRLFESAEYCHLNRVRHRTPRETAEWVKGLRGAEVVGQDRENP